jgi:hypothetical protein
MDDMIDAQSAPESEEVHTVSSPTARVEPAARHNQQALDTFIELFSAAVLALTTVLSAWCAYQAVRWSGVQANAYAAASAARMDAVQQADRANVEQAVDVGLLVQYVVAMFNQNTELADFLYTRFRPEMHIAMDAWLATQPFENPDAPLSPFAMPEYSLAARQQSQQLHELAEQKGAEARNANQTGDNYILLTVLLASVLFFGGLAGKLDSRIIRVTFLVLGAGVLLAAIGVMLTYPVE